MSMPILKSVFSDGVTSFPPGCGKTRLEKNRAVADRVTNDRVFGNLQTMWDGGGVGRRRRRAR